MFEFWNKPWWTIWTQTRSTIRLLLENSYSIRWGLLFVPLFGISMTLNQVSFSEYGDWYTLSRLLIVSLPIGLGIGWIIWLVYGTLFWSVGRLFGGEGVWKDMLLALAWATVPHTANLILWFLKILCFGEETFTLYTPTINSSLTLLSLYIIFWFLDAVLTIWYFIILIKSVSEVHGFSSWKGAGVVFLSLTLLWIVLKYVFGFVLMPF